MGLSSSGCRSGAVRVSGNVYLALKGGQSPLLRVISCRALRQPRLKFHAVIQGHAQIEQISGASILLWDHLLGF